MEPKDMTNNDLFDLYENYCEKIGSGEYSAICTRLRQGVHNEIVSRFNESLNEADALRKENEELRNAHAKLLKDYAELRVNSALLIACDDALESMDANESKESEASHDR